MILTKNLKIDTLRVVYWHKIYKIVLENTFSFFCGVSIFFWFLCRKVSKKALLRGENIFLCNSLVHYVYDQFQEKKNFTSHKDRFSNFSTHKPKKDRIATK